MKYSINFSSYDRSAELRKKLGSRLSIAATLFLLIALVYGIYRAADVRGQTAKIAANKESLSQKVEKERIERRKIIADDEVAVLESRMKFYRELMKARFYPTAFLNLVEQKTPPMIVMKSVDYDPVKKSFTLVCESFVPDGIAGLIPAFEGSSLVKRLQITRHNVQTIADKKQILSDFELKGEIY